MMFISAPIRRPNSWGTRANSFDPGTLAFDATYYWAIDEVNGHDITAGPIWSFTTAPAPSGDVVTILTAEWKASRQELKVTATSSEQPVRFSHWWATGR